MKASSVFFIGAPKTPILKGKYKMIPVISFVGKSNAGKTTLIEKLIPIFSMRGISVGTIKHHMHDFDMDVPGKDSFRHQKAGAVQTVISSPGKIAFVGRSKYDHKIDELLKFFDAADIIITDGYKGEEKPKIEVFRPSHYNIPITPENSGLIAYATDGPEFSFPVKVPVLDLNDPSAIAGFIIEYFDILKKIK